MELGLGGWLEARQKRRLFIAQVFKTIHCRGKWFLGFIDCDPATKYPQTSRLQTADHPVV
jgi:hypothetical protein